MVAIQREFNMRQKSKAQYYNDAQNDMSQDSGYYNSLFAKYFSLYRGSSLDGS